MSARAPRWLDILREALSEERTTSKPDIMLHIHLLAVARMRLPKQRIPCRLFFLRPREYSLAHAL
jgi:hypothetical protein